MDSSPAHGTSQHYSRRPWVPAADAFAAQPDLLTALPGFLAPRIPAVGERPSRVMIVGIGASHAAAAAGMHRMRLHGIDATRHLPGELRPESTGGTVVAVSQSGRSAEVVDLVSRLDGARVVSVTNYAPSPLADLADYDLNLGDHPDSSVSFVSFTGTVLALAMLADHWGSALDVARWERVVGEAVAAARRAEDALDAAADILAAAPFVDITAPAPLVGAAEEAALMFREGPRMAATGMDTRLYLHGAMDVAGSGAHLVIGGEREALLVDQLAEQTADIVFVATDDARPARSRAVVNLPVADPVGRVLAVSVLAQSLVSRVSLLRGVDIDEPVFERLDTKVAARP